jgi:hypothetical protein
VVSAACKAMHSLDLIANQSNYPMIEIHPATSAPCFHVISRADRNASHRSSTKQYCAVRNVHHTHAGRGVKPPCLSFRGL